MPGPEVAVLVVDDQRPFRTAARAVISRTPGFEVIGEAATGGDSGVVGERISQSPDLLSSYERGD